MARKRREGDKNDSSCNIIRQVGWIFMLEKEAKEVLQTALLNGCLIFVGPE